MKILPLFYNTDLMGGRSPRRGSVVQYWDLAFSEDKQADYTCGVTGLYDRTGRLFIVDILLGRFNPHDLLRQVVAMALRWRPFLRLIAIEKSGGAPLLELGLTPEFYRLNFFPHIEWVPISPKKTKYERIFGCHPLLKERRLSFSSDLPHKEDLIKQFIRFPYFNHDDIPDAVAGLLPFASMEEAPLAAIQPITEEPIESSYFDRLGGLIG